MSSVLPIKSPENDTNGNFKEKSHLENAEAIFEKEIKKEVKTGSKSTKKLKLDLDLTDKKSSLPAVTESKPDLVISLEKIGPTDTKNQKLKSPSKESAPDTNKLEDTPKSKRRFTDNEKSGKVANYEKSQTESNELKSPGISDKPALLSKSPEIEKTPLNTKELTAKDDKEVKAVKSRRGAKRKSDHEQDRKILGNSPPYVRFEDDTLFNLNDQTIPIDQVLGSVISANLNEDSRSPQVRSSARVIKKMRLEAVAPSTSKVEVVEKIEKKVEQKPETKQKAVRPWSHEEKIIFFDAVSEFGKDFENIHTYIHTKLKKRGVPDDQNRPKDQVRQFYYKVFHEIFRHVKFSDKIKRVVQELYGIINYGELYKKLGPLNDKSGVKLTEMIYRGSTVIKYKGRTLRVKTPMCRALRKLNQLDDNYEELQLPNRVAVEIRPKDMTSFYRIQNMAQNPRLKTALPLQKRISCLLACLNKRWKTMDAQNFEKSIVSTNPITHDLVPNEEHIAEERKKLFPPLRLSPPSDAKIELPSINLSEYLTRQTICLTAYEGRLGLDTYSDIQLKKKSLKQKAEQPKCDNTTCDKEGVSSKEDHEINSSNEAEQADSHPTDGHLADIVDEAINTILQLQQHQQKNDRQDSEQSEPEEIITNVQLASSKEAKKDAKDLKEKILDPESVEKIERIKKGWTEYDCLSLTIGELYLMYGADMKLVLEYSWDLPIKEEPECKKEEEETQSSMNFLERWNEILDDCDYTRKHSNLSHALSKLVSLVKLQCRRNQTKCPCGHVCGQKPGQNVKNSPSSMTSSNTPRPRKTSLEFVNFDNNAVKNELPSEQENTFRDNEMINFARTPRYISQPEKPVFNQPTVEQQLNSLQKLKPKYPNKKGRRVVVERKLPLLPNTMESGHQIVRMNIISREPIPEAPPLEKVVGPIEDEIEEIKDEEISQNTKSPIGIDSLPINSVSTSPTRILKEGEQWINSEVADYSFSSLLGHLESPVKNLQTPSASNMAADLSTQVDAHLQSLLSQSSVDFAANFADLARVTCEMPNEGCGAVKEEDNNGDVSSTNYVNQS